MYVSEWQVSLASSPAKGRSKRRERVHLGKRSLMYLGCRWLQICNLMWYFCCLLCFVWKPLLKLAGVMPEILRSEHRITYFNLLGPRDTTMAPATSSNSSRLWELFLLWDVELLDASTAKIQWSKAPMVRADFVHLTGEYLAATARLLGEEWEGSAGFALGAWIGDRRIHVHTFFGVE